MKQFFFASLFSFILFISCKRERGDAISPGMAPEVLSSQAHPATVNYPFAMHATGSFTISPVSATVVKINQEMLFTSSSPFALIAGVVTGYDDLTISSFPDRFFNGSFKFYGHGNDSLFATVTVQTSVFTDPINPQAGDFFGSEDFTGTYTITGGTGHYLRATGSGTFSAHSEWRPPIAPGTLFSGYTSVTGRGTLSVCARDGSIESMTH